MTRSDSSPTSPAVPLAAILCGGRGRRMGADKAGLSLDGTPLVERVWVRVRELAGEVVAVGGAPDVARLGVAVVPDRYPGADSLGGVATALGYARERWGEGTRVLVLACDMPFLEPALLRHLVTREARWDVVVPRVEAGYEPLCAAYRTTCLPVMEALIGRGQLRLREVFAAVRTREVPEIELRRHDPELRSFVNLNRPGDLERARQLAGG